MDKYIVQGGERLFGSVPVQSAKNSVLPLLAACVLADEKITIKDCPAITDVFRMADILKELGCRVKFNGADICVDSATAACHRLPARLTKELRSSVFMLGSILSRFRRARIAYPGGCDIGLRPIDLHLSGLKRLGVEITEEDGYINCRALRLKGADIMLDFPSVGATENIMLAAVKADGETLIRNAAREPEIVDLQNFLNRMGAKVVGAGSETIRIDGVKNLRGGIEYTPIKDRIEAGTFLIAAAMCGGEIEVIGCKEEILASLLNKLRENGCKIHIKNDRIYLQSFARLKANDSISTAPYPAFPTDLQAQILALNTVARGTALITENLFETRFRHVPELKKMGADITVAGRCAIVRGVEKLHGSEVYVKDLRGGAALTIAALAADGESAVCDIGYIDRGYSSFESKLKVIGGKIKRVKV